ncbi:NAD(P)H-binding protein [Qipengyuania thermophila]|uniref:NAD(P)H-binding protein n=1 Tax=Qipengyuania thermophila TaxID=2509361 RepID=UPI0010221CED|nr:NAD(P)H-binding protein [Qipengyuania thermophila]
MRIALVGASGLVGRAVLQAARIRSGQTLLALVRRPPDPALAAHACVRVAEPAAWADIVAGFRPEALICALGTTWRKSGRSRAAFRAVDHDLVVDMAAAARRGGATCAVIVSAVGADAASRSLYLKTKGQMERDLARLEFPRLHFLRPGLLRGERLGDRRLKEGAAVSLSPVLDRLLPERLSRFRSIAADDVAVAALTLCHDRATGVRVHHNAEIVRAACKTEES